MSKLITDAIELPGGTNLSLPTTRPDNKILKVSSNALIFDDKPTVELQTVYDYNVDGAVNFFAYDLTNNSNDLVGIYIEFDGLQSTSSEVFIIRISNSTNGRVSASNTFTHYDTHGYGVNSVSSRTINDYCYVATDFSGVGYTNATEDPRYHHTGSFYLLLDGKHSNLAQGENSVSLASMSQSYSAKSLPGSGSFICTAAQEPGYSVTTDMTNHDAQDFTRLGFYVNGRVSGTIRLAEIPRSNS